MSHHHTQADTEATKWCNRCCSFTQHAVQGGREGPCLQCSKAREEIYTASRREPGQDKTDTGPDVNKPAIRIGIWTLSTDCARWKCQCGETQTHMGYTRAAKAGSFAKVTALGQCERAATDHAEAHHPNQPIKWTFPERPEEV